MHITCICWVMCASYWYSCAQATDIHLQCMIVLWMHHKWKWNYSLEYKPLDIMCICLWTFHKWWTGIGSSELRCYLADMIDVIPVYNKWMWIQRCILSYEQYAHDEYILWIASFQVYSNKSLTMLVWKILELQGCLGCGVYFMLMFAWLMRRIDDKLMNRWLEEDCRSTTLTLGWDVAASWCSLLLFIEIIGLLSMSWRPAKFLLCCITLI